MLSKYEGILYLPKYVTSILKLFFILITALHMKSSKTFLIFYVWHKNHSITHTDPMFVEKWICFDISNIIRLQTGQRPTKL